MKFPKQVFVLGMGLVCLGWSWAVVAGPGPGRGGGWGMGSQYGRLYDPATVETISGNVVSVEHVKPIGGMSYGVHLIVKTDKETIPVHLGPSWFVENQEKTFAANDKVEIKGSRVTMNGKAAIIAAEVKRGDETLELRDAGGVPYWTGWRRRQAESPK